MKTEYEIFIGHFGSGKTELSLHFARESAKQGFKTALADLDIVNPYFRSASQREALQAQGIEVEASGFACKNLDLPSLPASISSIFSGSSERVVIDVGGDPAGAKVLGRYSKSFLPIRNNASANLVVNAMRPLSSSVYDIVKLCQDISVRSCMSVDCLINNTNLAEETSGEIIAEGHRVIEEAAKELGIPIRFVSGTAKALDEFKEQYPELSAGMDFVEITPCLRPAWLQKPLNRH